MQKWLGQVSILYKPPSPSSAQGWLVWRTASTGLVVAAEGALEQGMEAEQLVEGVGEQCRQRNAVGGKDWELTSTCLS
jgi:hypothetical protein